MVISCQRDAYSADIVDLFLLTTERFHFDWHKQKNMKIIQNPSQLIKTICFHASGWYQQ